MVIVVVSELQQLSFEICRTPEWNLIKKFRAVQSRSVAAGYTSRSMQKPLPSLYSFRRCPYAMRARLALDVSSQAFDVIEVALRDKPAEMLRASPKGTVPVLIDTDGTVIDESLDIMLWALRRSDPEQWLAPERDDLATMRSLIRHFDEHFKAHLDRYKYPNRFTGADADLSRSEAVISLHLLEARLQSSSYLFGNRIALADMAIVPFVRQFSKVDPPWFASLPLPNTARWLAAILDSPRFIRIMRRIQHHAAAGS